jgi:hypothetical protein
MTFSRSQTTFIRTENLEMLNTDHLKCMDLYKKIGAWSNVPTLKS